MLTFEPPLNLNYSLSEPLYQGKIILNRIGGTQDLNSPHIVEIEKAKLTNTENSNISFFDLSNLSNGAIYDLSIHGIDYAKNTSDTITINNITFDSEPPQISILQPNSNIFIDNMLISYNLSENLLSSKIKWVNIADPSIFYTYTLSNHCLLYTSPSPRD